MQNLFVGMACRKKLSVGTKDSDSFWGGGFGVLSSPSLIGYVEMACVEATDKRIDHSYTTVGVRFDFVHLAPTPVGFEVEIEVELVEFDLKMLTYKVEVADLRDGSVVFKGTHRRGLVKRNDFEEKILSMLNPTAT